MKKYLILIAFLFSVSNAFAEAPCNVHVGVGSKGFEANVVKVSPEDNLDERIKYKADITEDIQFYVYVYDKAEVSEYVLEISDMKRNIRFSSDTNLDYETGVDSSERVKVYVKAYCDLN